MKKAAIKIMNLWCSLQPDVKSFGTSDAKAIATLKKQHIEQRVGELLGPESLYLCGRSEVRLALYLCG